MLNKVLLTSFLCLLFISSQAVGEAFAVANYRIDGISPLSGPLSGGGGLTVNGSNLHLLRRVTVGGKSCLFVLINSRQISCILPAGAVGPKEIVTTDFRSLSLRFPSPYTYQAAPTISSVSPQSGSLAGGGTLTVMGTGFLAGLSISVGGALCSSPTLVSSTQASCTIPAGTVGKKNVVLTNSDKQSATLANSYTYQVRTPVVSGFSPTRAASGQRIALAGQDLELISSAQLGGINLTITRAGGESFFTVPQGLRRGEVSLSVNGVVQVPRLNIEPFCDPESVVTDTNSFQNLAINHASVVSDPNATFKLNDRANSKWSFPYLMARIAGIEPTDPNFQAKTASFIEGWAQSFSSVGTINGHNFGGRDFLGRGIWPRKQSGILDLQRTPMKLIAILYRPDLANAQQAGEGRFIYEVGSGNFTVILEFGLPINSTNSGATWVKRWADLSSLTLGTPAYNSALKAVTDSFTEQRFPGRPNGSAINQVRTNEIVLNKPWQLREWKLISMNETLSGVQLVPDTVKDTPKPDLNKTDRGRLVEWWENESCSGDRTPNANCSDVIPAEFLAGAANTEGRSFGLGSAFDLMTCNGCHDPSVSQFGFTHAVSGKFSPFLLNDLGQRRTAFRDALFNNFCQ